MISRKEILGKYYQSDIFNLNQKPSFKKSQPKQTLNRSNLENTKEEVFNIGKEKRISRNSNKNIFSSHSTEKRKLNYEKIYGSDIFNIRPKSVERRNGRHHMPNIANRSTCFEEMKNNEDYINNYKHYINEKRGGMNTINYNKSDFDNKEMNEKNLRYLKRRKSLGNDNINKNKDIIRRNNKLTFASRHPLTLYTSERRRFVDLDECPENNCKINKQIQFESHLFSDNDNNKNYKSNEEIKKIQERINAEKNKHYNINVLGQPIIKVNRLKRKTNTNSSMDNIHTKMKPTNMKWDSLQSQVMFSQDYTTNLYKKYPPGGPTAYQRRLHQFADSDNLDTLSGLEKNVGNNFKFLKKPKTEEIQSQEQQKKIEEMLKNIPNLSEGQKLEIKMKSSILDFRDENEFNDKKNNLNDFLGKERKKKFEVTEKVNNIDRLKDIKHENNKNLEYHDYIITYGIKGNNFENYNENEIKKMFNKKGINISEIHKNNFNKGNNYNTINIKVYGNNINDELNKKLKLMQEELVKKNYKLKIEKENKSKNIKNIVNNPGEKIAIMKDNLTNKKEEKKFKIMPHNYKVKNGFSKQFSAINYSYKNPNQIN